jgi:hypothetical protein
MKKYDRVKLKGDALVDLNLTSNDEVVIVEFYEGTDNDTPTKFVKVVDKDLNVHSVGLHEIITSDYGTKLKKVINILKDIEVCGEDMQYIIEEVGMSGQMLNQMSNKTGFSYVSHVDFNGDSFNRRFELIKDEVNRLRMIPACYMTNLNNIEVICDLNSDESLGWAFHGDEVNHTK